MKPAIAGLLLVITSVITGVILSPTTHAASQFDNFFGTTTDFGISYPQNSCNLDLKYLYTAPITQPFSSAENTNINGNSANYKYSYFGGTADSLSRAKQTFDNKQKWLTYVQTLPNGSKEAYFNYTDDPNASLSFGSYVSSWDGSTQLQMFMNIHAGYHLTSAHYSYINGTSDCSNFRFDTYNSNLSEDTALTIYSATSTNPTAFNFYYANIPINYPSGFSGSQPPDHAIIATKLNIGYAVGDDYILHAQYLRNIDPPITDLTYSVYSADGSYNQGSLLDSQNRNFQETYDFKLPSAGYYILKVNLYIHPPLLPRNDVQGVTFKINADGTFKIGSTVNLQCSDDGVCNDLASDCSYYSDVFQRMNCAMKSQLSLGLINPSITAFKNLFLSVIVPSNPTCSIPLQNISIEPGKVFPLSQSSAKICGSAAQFQSSFPFISLVANFIFSLALFYMIVRIINRFLNKDKNDMIEGV